MTEVTVEPTTAAIAASADPGENARVEAAIAQLKGDTAEPVEDSEPEIETKPETTVEPEKQERQPTNKAFKALTRLERKLSQKQAALESAREQMSREMAELAELRSLRDVKTKAKESPEEALAALGLSFEDIANAVLEKPKRESSSEIQQLRAELQAFQEQQRVATAQKLEHEFLAEASSMPELSAFAETLPNAQQEIIDSAYTIGRELQRELGRIPTNREILSVLEERAAVFNREAYSKLHRRYAESATASQAEQRLPGRKTGGASPKALSNAQSSEGARAPAMMSDDERFEAAVRMARAAVKGAA